MTNTLVEIEVTSDRSEKSIEPSAKKTNEGSAVTDTSQDDVITLTSSDTEKHCDKLDVCDTPSKINTLVVKDVKEIESSTIETQQESIEEKTPKKGTIEKVDTPLIKLSNTMDILSDDEEEPPKTDLKKTITEPEDKNCINLIDDDDIMLIDDETTTKTEKENSQAEDVAEKLNSESKLNEKSVSECMETESKIPEVQTEVAKDSPKPEQDAKEDLPQEPEAEKPVETEPEKVEKPKPLIPADFFKTYRKNLADMTRDDLEEFCILKIVESIIDRSNLNEIRAKLKTMGQTIEEYKKKAMMLSKQNRDLGVVLKSVQEEQKKSSGTQPITPLKITRSVGMQVLMTDKNRRRPVAAQHSIPINSNTVTNNQPAPRNTRNTAQSPRNIPQKVNNPQSIPVPKLVPAGFNNKTTTAPHNNVVKHISQTVTNAVKATPPPAKPEKRTHSRMQGSQTSSVTVDLTDDEPAPKVPTKSPAAPVRLVNQQQLMAPRPQFPQANNSPRKVYIPISINGGSQQSVRPGQAIMVKAVTPVTGPRPRGPTQQVVRPAQNVPARRVAARHPAPLPDAMKQYQPPNWKGLPPAPDLKLSKVENGIVISWKIEGYQEDSYESIASYQLYAYQETTAPPSTSLWKKIGDVKALPLPMACTLTQFMAGYKYYFAVRAVDIRSRLGPFSLPGSILLLNKM